MTIDENVRLKNLFIENWKCFDTKSFDFNDHNNFYNQKNGFGKTSLIQALIFCIYGKFPTGFKIKDLQKDKSKRIRFVLIFEHKNIKYTIERIIMPNGNKTCRFKEMDEDFREYSVNQMLEITSRFFGDSKFIDIIWSQTPLIYSDILKTSFVSSLISDCLQEQKEFSDALKIQNLSLSKEKKNIEATLSKFNGSEDDVDKFLKNIQKKKDELTEKLKSKSRSSINESKKSQAERCLKAREERVTIEKTYKIIYSKEEISEFEKLKANAKRNRSIVDNYSESLNKEIAKYKDKFSNAELTKFVKMNEESCKCPICDKKFSFKFSVEDLEHFEGKDDYEKATIDLAKLEMFNEDAIEISKKYHMLEEEASSCENPEEIIKEFNNQIEKDWDELEKVNSQIQNATKCKKLFTSLKDINLEMQSIQKLLEISKKYENEAIDFYTKTVIFRAMDLLSSVDEKYVGLFYNKITGTYDVCMSTDGDLDTRPVDSFSSGEKTVIALCLALSFKEVFAPNSILILDESLGSLDPDKLETCMTILGNVEYQTFVVAHNRK